MSIMTSLTALVRDEEFLLLRYPNWSALTKKGFILVENGERKTVGRGERVIVRNGGIAVINSGGQAIVDSGGLAEIRSGGQAIVCKSGQVHVFDGGESVMMNGSCGTISFGGKAFVYDGAIVTNSGKVYYVPGAKVTTTTRGQSEEYTRGFLDIKMFRRPDQSKEERVKRKTSYRGGRAK